VLVECRLTEYLGPLLMPGILSFSLSVVEDMIVSDWLCLVDANCLSDVLDLFLTLKWKRKWEWTFICRVSSESWSRAQLKTSVNPAHTQPMRHSTNLQSCSNHWHNLLFHGNCRSYTKSSWQILNVKLIDVDAPLELRTNIQLR
jgi:hypothetical protein